jgi:acetolactate synthase small subunit
MRNPNENYLNGNNSTGQMTLIHETDTVFNYNGENITFHLGNGNVMVNLTEVAKAFPNKNLSQIINSLEIREYVEKLSKLKNYSLAENQLLITIRGGNENGTWAHQRVALRVAQKLSTDFAIWCDERIEELITKGQTSLKPLSPIEILVQSAQMLLEQDKRINKVENKLNVLEAKTTTRPDYFTIVGYGTLHHVFVNLKQASSLGRKASEICKKRGIQTDRIPDPRFGEVKMYPSEVLDEVFSNPIN